MLLTETLQDVRRTSMSRPNRLALHQHLLFMPSRDPSLKLISNPLCRGSHGN